jgi:hypothetical protein
MRPFVVGLQEKYPLFCPILGAKGGGVESSDDFGGSEEFKDFLVRFLCVLSLRTYLFQ